MTTKHGSHGGYHGHSAKISVGGKVQVNAFDRVVHDAKHNKLHLEHVKSHQANLPRKK